MTQEENGTVAEMSDEQFQQYALEILHRTLGAGGFARFFRIYRPGSGNYTQDRHKWQKGITVPQIVEGIRKHREKTA